MFRYRQQVFTEHLLYARLCAWLVLEGGENRTKGHPGEVHFILVAIKVNKKKTKNDPISSSQTSD